MLLCTNGGLSAIGVCRCELLAQCTPNLVTIVGKVDVILLINSFQLGMETTDNHILETVGLNLSPVVNLIRRDVLYITGDIVRGEGIGALSTDGSHQLVVLIGNEVAGSHLRYAVDAMIGSLARLWVGKTAISLIASLDVGKQRSLGSGIGNTEMIGTLEHEVLQIVSKTCGFGRVVL